MIRKLQKRFIAAAMLSLAIVLCVLMSGINYMSYRQTVSDADAVLAVLSENQGAFPVRMPFDEFRRGDIRKGVSSFGKRDLSPEAPFESRFFSVVLDDTGAVRAMNVDRIAAVDAETAEECARQVAASGREKGYWGDYRYAVSHLGNTTQVIFLDCTRSLSVYRTTLLSSVLVALLGLGAVWVLLVLVSGRIVKPVAESYAKQKRFITDAGHEIKTPLTVISADTDLAELELGESEWLEDIRRQTRRLTDLTNDLVYLSRMDEEQPVLQFIEFPVSDVVEETAQSFQGLAARQEKELTAKIEPMVSYTGSEKEIRQLVSILLDNALKYSPGGGEIRVSLTRESKAIRLTVTNTTLQPVEKEQLSRMFDRFYRMDASRNSETGGYGLGLAIARSIVTAHKGRIQADSPEEDILRITVILP